MLYLSHLPGSWPTQLQAIAMNTIYAQVALRSGHVTHHVLSLSILLIVFESCLNLRRLTGTDTLTFLVKCSFIVIPTLQRKPRPDLYSRRLRLCLCKTDSKTPAPAPGFLPLPARSVLPEHPVVHGNDGNCAGTRHRKGGESRGRKLELLCANSGPPDNAPR